jgi:NADPH-dependent 2,4-dienoyl-CoA reductase/sulfur reductase-like enzyme/rhodanese-related sulfurtransferase
MSTNIVIIGGTACGPKAAARARRLDQAARITIIEQRENLSTATCGLPYYISGVIRDGSVMVARQADYFRNVFDMEVLTDTRATAINTKQHTVQTTDLKTGKTTTLGYDKLVLATGSRPAVPAWEGFSLKGGKDVHPEGRDLRGIFTLSSIPDAEAIRAHAAAMTGQEVVIIGAGLIGLEMAENFTVMGLKVTVLEALDWPLPALLDGEIAVHVARHLRAKGVNLICGRRVTGFVDDGRGNVGGVKIGDETVGAAMVLASLGVRPDVSLAKDAGLEIGKTGGLAVDEYLQTSDPDIYAGGDCVETVDLVTGGKTLVPLGSTANKHGRVIGTNLAGGRETFPGVMGTAIAKVFDLNVGRAGLSEAQAIKAGFEVLTTLVPGVEHATYYPGAREMTVKLVAEKSTGRLLGGQAVGPGDTAKRIDVLATALAFKASADDLAALDLAYAPPYNSAMDPLHNAANVIRNKREGYARGLAPAEVKRKLDADEEFILLDVRSKAEWQAQHFENRQAKLIPLPELRRRLGELPRDKEIVTFCRTSIRAYQAQRILDGAGFKDVKFLDGSTAGWPYDFKDVGINS